MSSFKFNVPRKILFEAAQHLPLSRSALCRGALIAALDPSDLAEAISDAVADVNEGQPLTTKQWTYVARRVIAHLVEEGTL